MINLTVSIVNYNAGEYLLRCLKSLEEVSSEAKMEIYVIDNNSTDDSIAKARKSFPKVSFILNKKNMGFGKAHNLILNNLKNEYVLILNPDTEVKKGTIKTILELMEEDKKVGISTCKVVLPDGSTDLTAHRGLPTPWAAFKYYFFKDESLYHLTNKEMTRAHEVDSISGSFMMTKRSVLEKSGTFDEDYFMYAEDIDICFNIKQAGFKVMYYPQVEIIHHKGISTGLKKHSQQSSNATLETKLRSVNAFYSTMKLFYKKRLERRYPFFINWLVYLGIDLKWFLAKRKLVV